jgi:hypothetical protein
MRGRVILASAIGFFALVLVLCASPGSFAKKEKKKDPAKRLYAKKCAGACHRLYKPGEYSRDQWAGILADMSERAKLSEKDLETIRGYLYREAAKEGPDESR